MWSASHWTREIQNKDNAVHNYKEKIHNEFIAKDKFIGSSVLYSDQWYRMYDVLMRIEKGRSVDWFNVPG